MTIAPPRIAFAPLLVVALVACNGTGEKRAELYKLVDELCERCGVIGFGGPCEFDADRLAAAGQHLVDASWEDLRYEDDRLEKIGLVRREVEAAEALAYGCFRQRYIAAGSPERLWLALHAAIKLPTDELRGPAIFALLSERSRRLAAVEATKLLEHRSRYDGVPISLEGTQKYLATRGFLVQDVIDRYHIAEVRSDDAQATLVLQRGTRASIELGVVRENGKWKLEFSKDFFGYRPPGST